MNSSDVALISPIDIPKSVTNAKGELVSRFYDKEALRCFSSWRKNGGALKDISIYALSFNPIDAYSEDFIKQLSDIGVNISFVESSEQLGFKNEILTGLHFENSKSVKEDIMIKIDLDMQLLKPLNEELIDIAHQKVVIGQYDEGNAKDQRHLIDGSLPFDTSFIISSRKMKFYELYMKVFDDPCLVQSDEWIRMTKQYGEYFKIEYAVDVISQRNLIPIHPVQYHQFGEGYRSIKHFTDDQVRNIFFLHEHIYNGNKFPEDYDAKEEHIQYIRRH